MKFYALKFDANLPTKQQVNITTNTDYKIGIKVTRNGEELVLSPANVTLGNLAADTEKLNGYVTFTSATDDNASMTVKEIDISSPSLKFQIVLNIYKSQQGEVDAGQGGDIDLDNVKTKSLQVVEGGYTLVTAKVGEQNDSGEVKVTGTDAKLVVGTANNTGSVRINSNGTMPNIQVGKSGYGDYASAALSCDNVGHGLLVLDNMAFSGAELSATFAANTILEGLA